MRRKIEQAGSDLWTAAAGAGQELTLMQKLFNRVISLAIAYGLIMTIAALMFSFIEGKDITDSFWWATVTATTVGYGDMFPTHPWSKFLAGVFMHVCTFIIAPIITAKFAAHLIVNSDAFTHEEQELLKNQSREQVELLREIMERLDRLENKS
jgi:voltage-gated potassium channel